MFQTEDLSSNSEVMWFKKYDGSNVGNSVDRYPLVGMDYRYYNKLLCSRNFFADVVHHVPNWKQLYDGNLFFLFHGDRLVAQSYDLSTLWGHVQ